ncbi:MAG: 30S ribosome-binding factor RbfA [Bdellovibrionales bacterium]
MRSQRQLRVGEEIRHVLAQLFQRGDVPPQAGMTLETITVTEVQVSPDLKHASVFVMPLGGRQLKETVKALNDMSGFFRHFIAQNIELRYAPRLRFEEDQTFAYAERIERLLQDPVVAKDLDEEQPQEGHDDDDIHPPPRGGTDQRR